MTELRFRSSMPLAAGFALAGLLVLASPCAAQGSAKAAKAVQAAEAACAAPPAASTRFVAATSARLRRLPRADGEAVATLPIGTTLQVECQVDAWVRAHSDGDAPARGWVRADLLQSERPTLEGLIAAHGKAPAGERRGLAERAVALAPFDARSHQLLIDTLTARRDRKAVQQATTARDRMVNPQGERLGKEPWTLFVVEDGMVNAVAIVDGPDRFRDASDWTPPGGNPNASPYLLPWRGLHFYHRGGADGVVQVLEAPTAEAIGFFSPVRHPPATSRDSTLDGIASNQAVTQVPAPPVAAPSRTERSVMDRELRQLLKKERVPARTVSALMSAGAGSDQGGVQRYVLPASGKPILLVTANWRLPAANPEEEGLLLDAVMLLEADGRGTYRVTHRQLQKTSGENLSHHAFIDQLDLDQDGVAELIFRIGAYEGSDYAIWRRQDGVWKQVFKGAYTGL